MTARIVSAEEARGLLDGVTAILCEGCGGRGVRSYPADSTDCRRCSGRGVATDGRAGMAIRCLIQHVAYLHAEVERLTGERDKASANYEFMVARAADQHFCAWQFERLIYWLTEANPEPPPMPERRS